MKRPADPGAADPRAGSRRTAHVDLQRQLDEALADSFPASDPVSIVTSQNEEDWGESASAAEVAPPAQPAPLGSSQASVVLKGR